MGGGGSRTSLQESAKFEDNSKPSSHTSHIRQKLVVQVVCTPGVCTHKGFDCRYSNGHNCCQQRIIFTVPTLCCLLPAFHQERREATASLLIIHTRTRYQPLCGEQIEITRDTFCNTFYFNTWGLGTMIKDSLWKKQVSLQVSVGLSAVAQRYKNKESVLLSSCAVGGN